MFGLMRFATRTVAKKVCPDLQAVLWEMIDKSKQNGHKLDYLQVFDLSAECALGEVFQTVVHRQEVPPRTETYVYRTISRPMNGTVWVMDSGDYATMLFPEDY